MTPGRHPYSVSCPRAFPPHRKQSCLQHESRTAPARPPGARLWTVWLDQRMEKLVFSNWLFKICDSHLCLERICNTARYNRGTGPILCKKSKKKKKSECCRLTNASWWALAAVNQRACQTSLVTTQAKPVGGRWHMLIVVPDDYLHKTKSNACYAYHASHIHVSHTLLTVIIAASLSRSAFLKIQMYSGRKILLVCLVFHAPDDKYMSKRLKIISTPSGIWLTAVILSAKLTSAAFVTLLFCLWISGFIKCLQLQINTLLWLSMHFWCALQQRRS